MGEVTDVLQPDYIIIKINNKTIALKGGSARFKDRNQVTRTFLQHGVELLFSITYHKTQGMTLDSLILSVNSHCGVSKKILPISLTSLYVGASRVHNHDELRILPCTDEDLLALQKLRRDPLIGQFLANFDNNGRWKSDGFSKYQATLFREAKANLGLFDSLLDLTKEEALHFVKKLDIIYDKRPSKESLIQLLQESHKEGRSLVKANSSQLLRSKRLTLLKQLHNDGLQTQSLSRLRFYGKRLGVKNVNKLSKARLRKALSELLL